MFPESWFAADSAPLPKTLPHCIARRYFSANTVVEEHVKDFRAKLAGRHPQVLFEAKPELNETKV